MREITAGQFREIVEKNKLWINGKEGGDRANLSGVNLRHANLSGVNLRHANLSNANLSNADLRHADLSNADLRHADLSDADLRHADLSDANLRRTNLSDANLSDADLSDADLRHANLSEVDLSEAVARLDFGGWSICVRHNITSIGCRTCSNDDWLKWSPEDVANFDSNASDWWATHGDAVKAVIRCVMGKHRGVSQAKNKTTA